MRLIGGLAALVLSGSMALAVDGGGGGGGGGRMWVAPFSEANDSGTPGGPTQNPDWISRALRQSVVDDLAALKGVSVTNTTATAAAATNAPTTRPSDVDYVVSGTIQRVNGELRVSGRVEDVAGNRTVGGFKATGSEKELFAIEDSIAGQLKSTLAPASSAPATSKPAGGYAAEPGGTFEGSDLQRALADRDYLRQLQMAGEPAPEYGYTQPVDSGYSNYGYRAVYSPFLLGGPGYVYYPNYNYSPYGYGYGGYPYGYGYGGGSNVVIINNGSGGHGHHGAGDGHGDHGGGRNPMPTPHPNVQAAQMQAIRNASSWAGNPAPGVVTTMTHAPVNTMTSVPQNTMTSGPQLVPGGATPGRR
jgi:TolB-like protein